MTWCCSESRSREDRDYASEDSPCDCAHRRSHSAVSTNVALLHCAQNLPQYQFARNTFVAKDVSLIFEQSLKMHLLSALLVSLFGHYEIMHAFWPV